MACFRITIELPDGTVGAFHQGKVSEWFNREGAYEAFVAAVGTTAPGLVVDLLADGKSVARCRVVPIPSLPF